MTDLAVRLGAALREHAPADRTRTCGCGWVYAYAPGSGERFGDAHRAHVVEVLERVVTEWLVETRDARVEAAAVGICEGTLANMNGWIQQAADVAVNAADRVLLGEGNASDG